MSDYKFPTEEVELPSKGLLYPESSPLSKGVIEMKYMTAKEEDILTNQAFIKKGIVLDKLLRSLVVTKDANIDDLVIGDKNAILIASRLLGYGAEYKFTYGGEEHLVDLNELDNKPLDESKFVKGKNEFEYTTPPRDMTAISVVPPPMSITIEPIASDIGKFAPIVAAIGSSINCTLLVPAANALS